MASRAAPGAGGLIALAGLALGVRAVRRRRHRHAEEHDRHLLPAAKETVELAVALAEVGRSSVRLAKALRRATQTL